MKTYTYYIYHIAGIKIGCTNRLESRMAEQGFTEWEILWQEDGDWNFGWIAGDKELELQEQYGYEIDKTHYQVIRENWRIVGLRRGLMEDMRGDQQTATWSNYTVEERLQRCKNISEGKKGKGFSTEHRGALSKSKIQPQHIIDSIRKDIDDGILSYRAIARKHNKSNTVIYNIRDNKKGYQ